MKGQPRGTNIARNRVLPTERDGGSTTRNAATGPEVPALRQRQSRGPTPSAPRWEELQCLLNASSESLLLLEPQGTIAHGNAAAATLLDTPYRMLRGLNLVDLLPNDVAETWLTIGTRVLATSEPARWRDTLGRHVLDNRLTPVEGAASGCRRLILASRTVVERGNSMFSRAARRSSMAETVDIIAAALNQPLTAIANYSKASARLLRSNVTAPLRVLTALDAATDEAMRAGDVLRRIQRLLRTESPQWARVDLTALVDDVVRTVQIEQGIPPSCIEVNAEPGLPEVLADESQVGQVIMNLLINALEAMRALPWDRRRIEISLQRGEGHVELAVCDTGEGIAADSLEQIFDPFVTTDPTRLGMGLTIGRSIVEAHGGRLWAARNGKRGMTFRFTLPTTTAALRRQ